MSAIEYDGIEVDLDPDTEDVVLESRRHPGLARALEDLERQASAELHAAAQKLPMASGLTANDLLRRLDALERRLEDLERQPC
jgi:hypothetical protein